jgi:hypothetical protein
MSEMGLGCVRTLGGGPVTSPLPVGILVLGRSRIAATYALMAAINGRMPIRFITRVRL